MPTLLEAQAAYDALLKEREGIEEKMKPFQEALKPLHTELNSNSAALREAKEKLDTARLEEMDKTGQIDWSFLLTGHTNAATPPVSRRLDKEVASRFDMYPSSGYYPNTNQGAVKIKISTEKPDSLIKNLLGIRTLLPHIIPMPAKDYTGHSERLKGFAVFGIFEHTAGEGGSVQLCLKPDLSEIKLCYRNDEKKFPSLEEAMLYIQQNHWYD